MTDTRTLVERLREEVEYIDDRPEEIAYGRVYAEAADHIEALEARAQAAEAERDRLKEALKQAEFAMAEAAIPLEAIVATGKGHLPLAIWDGACNAVSHVRRYLDSREALKEAQ